MNAVPELIEQLYIFLLNSHHFLLFFQILQLKPLSEDLIWLHNNFLDFFRATLARIFILFDEFPLFQKLVLRLRCQIVLFYIFVEAQKTSGLLLRFWLKLFLLFLVLVGFIGGHVCGVGLFPDNATSKPICQGQISRIYLKFLLDF